MRRLLILLVGLILPALCVAQIVSNGAVLVWAGHPVYSTPGAGAAISIGQFTQVQNGYTNSLTTPATSSPTTTGSTFVVFDTADEAFSTGTITDTFSNTYTHVIADVTFNGMNRRMNAWVCQHCTGGASHSVTITFPNTGAALAQFIEIKNASVASLDQHASVAEASGGGTTITPPSLTTTAAPEIVIAYAALAGAATYSAPTNSFTIGQQITDGSNESSAVWAYRFATPSGAYSTTLTTSAGGSDHGTMALSFK